MLAPVPAPVVRRTRSTSRQRQGSKDHHCNSQRSEARDTVLRMSAIGVGLVGFGKAGRLFHAPLIEAVRGLRLRTIVQRHGDDALEHHPDVSLLRDSDALLRDANIALVVIATPNDTHFDLARAALEAGKHVVVDKPFTVTAAEAAELIDLARSVRRLVTVFQNRRWDGDFLTVRHLIQQKALGTLTSFESRFDRYRDEARPGAWRESGRPGSGLLYDLGSHLVDQALLLFGAPASIDASVRRERPFGNADDAFDIVLRYPGLEVALGAGMLVRHPTPRFTLRGTGGTFVKFGLDPQEEALAAGRSPLSGGWGSDRKEQWGRLLTAEGDRMIETLPGNYPAFYENVCDAIEGRAPLAVTAEQARAAIVILEQAGKIP